MKGKTNDLRSDPTREQVSFGFLRTLKASSITPFPAHI